ncbi:hypothetical protein JJJ17_02660 [Paracoccus caeni]|uniref:Uncharacterized protein n=1 Tax=Paracoccus caeni TaxID=657651 RepID=A0A934SG74_9RHOB|nr:hypothetical protein [Paracoccus caeni]MBK4214822.1 hypothetical protein [Paracoccus caeni]
MSIQSLNADPRLLARGAVMRWRGEAEAQWLVRMKRGSCFFAWFPTQMDDGTWV